MLGRLTAMLVLGCLSGLGLWALGSDADRPRLDRRSVHLFPYVGAFASALPGLLLSLAVSRMMAVYVAGLYLLLHAVEG